MQWRNARPKDLLQGLRLRVDGVAGVDGSYDRLVDLYAI